MSEDFVGSEAAKAVDRDFEEAGKLLSRWVRRGGHSLPELLDVVRLIRAERERSEGSPK